MAFVVASGLTNASTQYNNGKKIVKGTDGTLYSAACSQISSFYQISVYKSADDGLTWQNMSFPQISGYSQVYPSIAIDSSNNLHVVWYGVDSSNATNNQIKYANNIGGSWSAWSNIALVSGYNQGNAPSIAIDSNNKVHVAWSGTDSTSTAGPQIKYVNNISGSWSTWVNVTSISGSYSQQYPSIAIDSNNKVHVAWHGNDSTYAQMQIKYVNNVSGSWSATAYVATISSYAQQFPCIAIDSNNKVHVAWHGYDSGYPSNTQIKYSNNISGSWSAWVNVTSLSSYPQAYPAIVLDANNKVHLTWQGTDSTYSSYSNIKYAHNVYGTWATWMNRTTATATQTFPAILHSNGTLYFFYTNSTSEIDIAKWRVPKTDLNQLTTIGDNIIASYSALYSGSTGLLGEPGRSADTLIPPIPLDPSSGTFYFIYVDNDTLGNKVLIADRAIQNMISWDTLNTAGITSGLSLTKISNIGYFNKVVYVDPVNGLDTNSGTAGAPVKTLKQALSMVPVGGALRLLAGTHTINTTTNLGLYDLCTTKGLSFIGSGPSTIIEVPAVTAAYTGISGASNAFFYNMVIRPAATVTGEQRAIWYTDSTIVNNYKMRFKNVTFTKNAAQNLPTQWYFIWAPSTTVNPDVIFDNCSFTGSILPELNGGTAVRYRNSAISTASANGGGSQGSLFNVNFDSNINITSGGWQNTGSGYNLDGTVISIGVYGGQLSWATYTPTITADGTTIRLPTGSTGPSDTDDEWDKYIVNSVLNGLITAGDTAVWNWKNQYTWCSSTPPGGDASRVVRGYSAANYWYSGGLATNYSSNTTGFRPVLVAPVGMAIKYLFQDGTDIKAYNTGAWSTVGQAPATEAMFTANGMTDLTSVSNTALQALVSSTPQLLVYVKPDSTTGRTAKLTAVPNPKLVLSGGDLRVRNITSLNTVTLNANQSGGGVVRVIVSTDSGTTWKTWNGSAWVAVDISNIANVKANGMSPATINALTAANLNAMLGITASTPSPPSNVRFGYYIEMAASADVASTTSLVFTVNMLGTWSEAAPGTDYSYGYPDGVELKVSLYSNGDFKINY